MAQLGRAFDSSRHDDMNSGFDPIPAGDYVAKIVESDVLQNSKKNGKYIKFKFEILKGEFKGRFVWTNLNIINPSTVAVEIAQKELATICRACGKGVIQDTAQLHGIPIIMKVKIKPAKGDYPAGNEPCGYTSVGSKSPESGSDTGSDDAPWGDDDEQGSEEDAPWEDEKSEESTLPDDDIPF